MDLKSQGLLGRINPPSGSTPTPDTYVDAALQQHQQQQPHGMSQWVNIMPAHGLGQQGHIVLLEMPPGIGGLVHMPLQNTHAHETMLRQLPMGLAQTRQGVSLHQQQQHQQPIPLTSMMLTGSGSSAISHSRTLNLPVNVSSNDANQLIYSQHRAFLQSSLLSPSLAQQHQQQQQEQVDSIHLAQPTAPTPNEATPGTSRLYMVEKWETAGNKVEASNHSADRHSNHLTESGKSEKADSKPSRGRATSNGDNSTDVPSPANKRWRPSSAAPPAPEPKCDKEKNRQAQRRFRERQKVMINNLREEVHDMHKKLGEAEARIWNLERENIALKAKLEACQGNMTTDTWLGAARGR